MKLGLIVNCFKDLPWEEVVERIKTFGLSAIEPNAGGHFPATHCNPELFLKDTEALKKFMDTYKSQGIEISGLAVHANPLHPDEKVAAAHTKDIVNAILLAEKMGVKVLTGFAGCPGAAEDAVYPNWITCPWPGYFADAIQWQWEKKIIPFWKEMAKRLRDAGVVFAFEMAPGDVVYNPETLLMLRDGAGDEMCCNFDPSHLFFQGIDPFVAIKKLAHTIVHVHAKDSKVDMENTRWRGTIDWKTYGDVANRAWVYRTCGYGHDRLWWNDFVSYLRIAGYEGVISIEHEDTLMTIEEGLEKAITFLKDVLIFQGLGEKWWV
jgi:sugar phosphate isomerase/epimerase